MDGSILYHLWIWLNNDLRYRWIYWWLWIWLNNGPLYGWICLCINCRFG
uniref:Uncharacterized protein n=1 Tax=Arundo donax TaxID=35708 RepID=A0A0A9AA18_ARUDO